MFIIEKDHKQFFQQETMQKMYEMYQNWIEIHNNSILVKLPKCKEFYLNILHTKPMKAICEWNLLPTRCFNTFIKMRAEFRIRHYKGKNWRYIIC